MFGKSTITRYIIVLLALLPLGMSAAETGHYESTKKERKLIKEGIEALNDSNYNEAIDYFDKALLLNPNSTVADYNKALALSKLRKPESADNKEKDPWAQADSIFSRVTDRTKVTDPALAEKALYNRGNLAYGNGDYGKSIDFYKKALRIKPDDIAARENLRLAQLKIQQQQNNENQDGDSNEKDKDNKEDQKDQQQNQQNQQQDQQQQDQQQNQQQQQQEQQPKQDELSGSAQQILQSMQNKENATREKVNRDKRKNNAGRITTDKPW